MYPGSLVERFVSGSPVATGPDMTTFYTAGEKGYTDNPVYVHEVSEIV